MQPITNSVDMLIPQEWTVPESKNHHFDSARGIFTSLQQQQKINKNNKTTAVLW